mgnify:CR=1 FL=1
MRKETDLARVKMIAHVLLDMPIAETSFSPAIVSHPFTSTGVTAAQNEDGNITVVDLLHNKEDYDSEHFVAQIEVNPSGTFYGWVFKFMGGVKITAPQKCVEEMARIARTFL